MPIIKLPYSSDLLAGLSATSLHSDTGKDATPVIAHVRIDQRAAVATDRFTMARYEHTTLDESVERWGESGPSAEESEAFVLVPRVALEWLAKQTVKALGGDAPQSVEFAADAVTLTDADGSIRAANRYPEMTGNFPPVVRLLDGCKIATDAVPVRLSANLLTRIAKNGTQLGHVVEIQLTKTDNPSKPGPILATVGDRFTALIQPNMVLR